MFTEFEIISIVISFILCFIIIYLHEMLDICKSERDMYYKMFTKYHDEYKKYIRRNRELEDKYKDLLKRPPKPMPSIVSDLKGVYRQREGESHEAFMKRLHTDDYDYTRA